MYDIRIAQGGKLIANIWDSEKKKSFDRDVSDNLLYHLDDDCVLEDNVTLNDIIQLIKPYSATLSPVLTKSSDLINNIVLAVAQPPDTDTDLKSLVLSWWITIDSWEGEENCLTERVDFSAMGKPNDDDMYKDLKPGELISYSLSLTSVNQIGSLPIKLKRQVQIYDERESLINAPVLAEVNRSFRLLDILKGIFWELTFFGSEQDKVNKRNELNETVEGIRNGTIKTIPWEEVKASLKDKIDNGF